MKKADIYEIGFKLFGFYLFIKATTLLFGNLSVLLIRKHIQSETNIVFLILTFLLYLLLGFIFFFRTAQVLQVLRINDSKHVEVIPTRYSYHIAIILLGGLLITNNISDIATSSYERETSGEFQNTIYQPKAETAFHAEVVKIDLPRSYTFLEKKNTSTGSLIGLILGVLTILFSKQLTQAVIPKELKEKNE